MALLQLAFSPCKRWPCTLPHHRIVESLRLDKTSKIIESNHHPNTTVPAKPYPKVPHLHIF